MVCYEVYTLKNRPGYSFIFERGGFDGFSPQDVELFLELTGDCCEAVANYQFRNVTRLVRDFDAGRFRLAFLDPKDVKTVESGHYYLMESVDEIDLDTFIDGFREVASSVICRRVADFPNEQPPAGVTIVPCAKCGELIVFDPHGPHQDLPHECFQCNGVEPLPFSIPPSRVQ